MQELIKLVDKILPVSGMGIKHVEYIPESNLWVSKSYTSHAGNIYFNGYRLSDRIAIVLNYGIGHTHAFLNGVSIYSYESNELSLVGFRNFHNNITYYDDPQVKSNAKNIIYEKLISETIKENFIVDKNSINEFVENLVNDAYANQIEVLRNIDLRNRLFG